MEAVSTIMNLMIEGYGILVWNFVIDGRLGKYSVIAVFSIISNFVITGTETL